MLIPKITECFVIGKHKTKTELLKRWSLVSRERILLWFHSLKYSIKIIQHISMHGYVLRYILYHLRIGWNMVFFFLSMSNIRRYKISLYINSTCFVLVSFVPIYSIFIRLFFCSWLFYKSNTFYQLTDIRFMHVWMHLSWRFCDLVLVSWTTRQRKNSLNCLDFRCSSKIQEKRVSQIEASSPRKITKITERQLHARNIWNMQRSKDIESSIFRKFFLSFVWW